MGKKIPTTVSATIAGKEMQLESGKLAALADGSVVLRIDDMMLHATAVANLEASLIKISFHYLLNLEKNSTQQVVSLVTSLNEKQNHLITKF